MLSSLLLTSLLATQLLTQHLPFDPREATISSVHEVLFSGSTTCHNIVSAFLARISHFNPLINAIITLNPDALAIASSLDCALASGNATSFPLFCIPILLKDSYDALPMPTTGGCLALNASYPTTDAPSITALRRAGAVILGKTNLHELALEGLSVSSIGGQTINPYDPMLTPGGSSGGTGAAIASSFAVFGTGTDTVNSLRSPASANSLYSFRPTRGLISRAGVIPVSYTQDTLGAIGRSLPDIATALTVMASTSPDSRDNATAHVPPSVVGVDYTAFLAPRSLPLQKTLRLGIIRGFYNTTPSPTTTPVNIAMSSVEFLLTTHNITLVNITSPLFNSPHLLATLDTQQFEYCQSLTSYLSSPHLTGPRPRSMAELYLNTSQYLVMPHQYPLIQSALCSSTSDAAYQDRLSGIAKLTTQLHDEFSFYGLDALLYPEQSNLVVPIGSPSQKGRNGILAALTGFPVVTIPIGFSEGSATSETGTPIGMEILGLPWTEGKLLGIASVIDAVVRARRAPAWVGRGVDEELRGTLYEDVPQTTPDRGGIDALAYPLGRIGR